MLFLASKVFELFDLVVEFGQANGDTLEIPDLTRVEKSGFIS